MPKELVISDWPSNKSMHDKLLITITMIRATLCVHKAFKENLEKELHIQKTTKLCQSRTVFTIDLHDETTLVGLAYMYFKAWQESCYFISLYTNAFKIFLHKHSVKLISLFIWLFFVHSRIFCLYSNSQHYSGGRGEGVNWGVWALQLISKVDEWMNDYDITPYQKYFRVL